MEKSMGSQAFGNYVEAILTHFWGYVVLSWGYVGLSWGYVGPS